MIIGAEKQPTDLSKGNADDWFTLGRFSLLLGLLIGVLNYDVLLGTQTFYFRDFGFFGYPLAYYHKQSFWSGEIPLWNPLNNSGIPFMAQWNTLVFYPGSLIYLLLPLPWSLSLYCLVHLFLAGVFMYLLAYNWTQNRLAASVAGMAYVFNGLALNCLMWPNNIAALAWMPLVILTAERAWTLGGRHLIIAAMVGATQMLSGAPEFIICTWGIVAVIGIVNFFQGKQPRLRMAVRATTLITLIAGLSAIQLLPFLQLLDNSQRIYGFGTDSWAMPGTGWANLFVPLFRNYMSQEGVYFQWEQMWTSSYYLGIGTLMLALFAALKIRQWRTLILTGFALFSLILALGNSAPLYRLMGEVFPQLALMRFPIKLIIPCLISLPLLAAFTTRYFFQRPVQQSQETTRLLPVIALIFSLLIVGIVWFSFKYPVRLEFPQTTLVSGISRLGILLVLASLFSLPKSLFSRIPKVIGLLVLGIIATDGITHVPSQNPRVSPGILQPGTLTEDVLDPFPEFGDSRATITPEIDSLFRKKGPQNLEEDFLLERYACFSNLNLLDDIPKINGFYSLYLQREFLVWYQMYILTPEELPGLYDFLGISQMVVASENVFDWTSRETFQPLLSIGQQPEFKDPQGIFDSMINPEFAPSRVVYLDDAMRDKIKTSAQPGANILNQRIERHRIEAEVQTPNTAMMVIAQSHYSPWKAYVDGIPTPIHFANYAYQAIEVPAGNHNILLVYEDSMFKLGAAISLVSLIVLAFLFFLSRNTNSAKRNFAIS